MMAAILAVLLMAGCVNGPEKEASNTSTSTSTSAPSTTSGTRYVQINLLDGTSVGGKYVSETAAFTTINVMYTLDPEARTFYNNSYDSYVKDPDKYIVRGNGAEISIKNALINTMITVKDPEQIIAKAEQEVDDDAAIAQKAYEEKMRNVSIERAKYEAEIAKRMPNK
jgi:hypothetical protein